MKEILGGNLKKFFDIVDKKYSDAEITYAGNRYEVWEVSDELFKRMSDMSEEEFVKLAGEDAWWRFSEGSNLGIPYRDYVINEKEIIAWDNNYRQELRGASKGLKYYACPECGQEVERY